MKILIACEFSGIVREAFRKRGHDAYSCDLLPSEIPGHHHTGDVIKYLLMFPKGFFDLIIAHTPCTYNANSGVRWLVQKDGRFVKERYYKMVESCAFFNSFKSFAEKVANEHPIPHKYAINHIGMYNQIIQPWQFGHPETKATCLWLQNLPKLKPTNIVGGRYARVHKEPPGKNRWKNRSRTYTGIAEAMAEQWG